MIIIADDYFKKMAVDIFAQIIIKSNLYFLKFYIENGISLIKLPASQKYVSTIRATRYIPIIGDYLSNKLKLEPEEVLSFIRQKNQGVYDLLSTEQGKRWYLKQFDDWMNLVK